MPSKKKTAAPLVAQSDPRAPLDGAAFLTAAQRTVATLRDDLLRRADASPGVATALRAQWAAEKEAKRTGDEWEIWRRRVVVQIATAWVLSLVFARTLEDRGLVERNRIAGPGATDSQDQFRALAPYLTDRDYLLTVFRELANLPAAGDLFDPKHNPVWKLGPSIEGARALLDLFRAPDAEAPSFRFGQADTRFLGDLYQSLDEETRERFALLQTPHFIEKYILDRTLERAIDRFGLDDTTLIDPTCGSGHFLLGAFERLVDHRLRKEPGLDVREVARRALEAVSGSDINPYAVAIARFRLTLAFLDKGGYRRLEDAPTLPLHVVVGDSLLHAPAQASLGDVVGTSKEAWAGREFALEDEDAAKAVLFRRYAAVVGNPPYITVKDAAMRELYRAMYASAYRSFSMGVPFTERFFSLARSRGFVGMITANSFMKREFGRKLILDFLPTVNLDGVVNASGAYIPGHGTPTVLLFGSNEPKQGADVLTVLAKRGEPNTPDDPEQGLVWQSIAKHGDEIGFDNNYVSVARVPRTTLETHPWSLGGGGAADLKELIEDRAEGRLADLIDEIGTGAKTREDELFMLDEATLDRWHVQRARRALGVTGEGVRDWIAASQANLWPYDRETLTPVPDKSVERALWPWRTQLRRRVAFGKTQDERGLPWTAYSMFFGDRMRTELTIGFAFVATHNHFILWRGLGVFHGSAPIIKLKGDATEEDHIALLAYLNSSTACFWMKQVLMDKGATSDRGVLQADPEKFRFEFDGTKMATVPIPANISSYRNGLVREYGRRLADAASTLAGVSFEVFIGSISPRSAVADLQALVSRRDVIRGRMVAWQEELDWLTYELFGLIQPNDSAVASGAPDDLPPRDPDERAYRRADADPVRARAIASSAAVALIERPEFKRRWFRSAGAFDADNVTDAMRAEGAAWNVLRAELERAIGRSEPTSSAALLAASNISPPCLAAAQVLRRGLDKVVVREALEGDAVPYLAADRYTDAGLEKRREWERVWSLQRAEDRGDSVSPFDPPPKYDQKDYRNATFWRLRGKLDVPKERFISYPGCESDEDMEPVFGWAGWNHLQRAIALATLCMKRKQGEAWGKDRLVPMLAGLDELLPWVWQWHPDPTPESGGMKPGQYVADFLAAQCHELGVTVDELRAWRPAAGRKKGASPAKKRASKKAAVTGEEEAS